MIRSDLSPSTGCADDLEPAAGCVQVPSEGQPGDLPAEAVDSTECASTKAADVEPDRPQPPRTLRAFERALRDLGWSQRQAAAIAREGFKGATAHETAAPEPEPDPDMTSLMAALQRRAEATKGTTP